MSFSLIYMQTQIKFRVYQFKLKNYITFHTTKGYLGTKREKNLLFDLCCPMFAN